MKVPQRESTGIAALDFVLGCNRDEPRVYGYVKPSVVLVAGPPGVGKTLLLLRVCANLAPNQSVLFNSTEQTRGETLACARMFHLEGFTHARVLSIKNPTLLIGEIRRVKAQVAVVDSLNKMPGNGTLAALQEEALAGLRTIFVTVHTKRDVNVRLIHRTGVVLMMSNTGYHRLGRIQVLKNRFGKAPESATIEF